MGVELFRSSGGEACTVTLREAPEGEAGGWQIQLSRPAQLVLAFLNEEYAVLTEETRQEGYLHEAFARGNGTLLREMIDHVLVCEEERGFDPVVRLAAYSYSHELFDLSRLSSYTNRVSLETSVVGKTPMEQMAAGWQAILEAYKAEPFAQRSDLFQALVADAQAQHYPFELGVATEYPSISQLLKAFITEMVRRRVLLRRCPVCGRYSLAAEDAVCGCQATKAEEDSDEAA